MLNVILLSGGSGMRLWPLSNEVRSKQFLKIFKNEDGIKESMVQRMYRMFKLVDEDVSITIATYENQVAQIKNQLGDNVDISIEPCRRDTFPAIVLASAYLKKKGFTDNEPIIVCPVDPYVGIEYFEKLCNMVKFADNANLTLMGIKPTYPSTKYGYILPDGKFTEKPSEEIAKNLISKGALWNGGIFEFKLGYILDKAKKIIGYNDYDSLYENYEKLEKISFDYAVAEKENSIQVIEFYGEWLDLGTWNTLTEAMSENISGNVVIDDCDNTHIINELSLPIVGIGLKNVIVSATPDGIIVSDKEKSDRIKELIKNKRPMYEERKWGEYRVLDYQVHKDGNNSLTKELIIKKGEHISYQVHKHRTEIWTFIEGEGQLIIDDNVKKVVRGDSVTIYAGTKHAIKADSELHIIEVQVGNELTESDIERLDFDWSKYA